jgi:NAD(P)-dependent dehydrogenase (short-subunit alcohol dehydrogenase family)
MSSGRLKGLAAIVTGVAGGVGGAVARRFRNEGARVVGVDNRDPEGMALDGFVVCDVGVSGAVDKAMATALALLGGELDILVTAAARTGGRGRFPDVTDAEWQSYIDVNLGGTFFVCRAAAKVMIARARGGSIVTVGSVNSMLPRWMPRPMWHPKAVLQC